MSVQLGEPFINVYTYKYLFVKTECYNNKLV
jgi:hypothetical protein